MAANNSITLGDLSADIPPAREYEFLLISNGIPIRETMTFEEARVITAFLVRMIRKNELTEDGMLRNVTWLQTGGVEWNVKKADHV